MTRGGTRTSKAAGRPSPEGRWGGTFNGGVAPLPMRSGGGVQGESRPNDRDTPALTTEYQNDILKP